MDPSVALRRIAYLLEAKGAETYKVRAFRTAAAAIDAVDPARVEILARSGRIRDLKGVGETTARVINEAVAGETPAYLSVLEEERPPQLEGVAAALRDALRGDCHCHSLWSDGGSPIAEMAQAAKDLGHEYLVMTDHSPRLTVAHGLNRERLVQQLDEIDALNIGLAPFRILTGMEVDILEDGALDQDEDLLERLDLVVASVHSKLRMDEGPMTRRMVSAVLSPHTDILGHCTGRLLAGRGRPQSAFDPIEVFAACAETGTAVEINSRPERQDPPPDVLGAALESGCLVSIDTDAHAPGQLEWITIGCEIAASAGVRSERVVNSRDAGGLLAWAASHGTAA